MKFADLHLHTLFSDGTFTPERLISEAIKANLSAIAIVDHDTVDGLAPTATIARANNIELLPGIELTAEYAGVEIHFLGYLIDYKRKELLEKLDFLKKVRIERIYKTVERLDELGLKLRTDSVFALAGEGTVGRLHIARAMVKERLVGSTAEAFQRYIGDKCPGYVLGFRFSPFEAIRLIKEVSGIAVLAHPYILRHDEWITQFIEYGLMGIEVYYPEHSQSMINFYLNLAKEHNLLVTGGSDCHGEAKPQVKIGSVKIPYDLVDALKAAKEKFYAKK